MNKFKVKKRDLILTIALTLLLGFQTNRYSFEKNFSTIVIVFLVLLMFGSNKKLPRLKFTRKYIIWYSIFTAYCVASVSWAYYDNGDYIYALIKDTFIPMVSVIILIEYNIEDNIFHIVNSLVIAEFIALIRAIINTPIIKLLTTMDTRLFASGLGVSYNNYTTQLTLVALILSIAAYYKKTYGKIFWIAFIIIILTGSRKAIIISALTYAAIYCVSGPSNAGIFFKRSLQIAAIGGVWLLLIYRVPFLYNLVGSKLDIVIKSLINQELVVDRSTDMSLYARNVLREGALEQFRLHPITGLGYYCFSYTNYWRYYAHNNYLELLASLGVVGFLIYYSMYIYKLMGFIRNLAKSKAALFAIIFLVMMIGMEYAQVTFFRPFAIIPMIVMMIFADHIINEEKKRNLKHVLSTTGKQ